MEAATEFTVYVIQSSEGYRYVGQTADLPRRLEQHNSGLSLWTKRGTNWSVIYFEIFATRREALTREKWLKSGVGRDFLKNISREGS